MVIFLSLISAVLSLLFIAYGIGITLGSNLPVWFAIFALVSIAYGVANLLGLFVALRSGSKHASSVSKYTAIAYLIFFSVASFDVGRISGLELLGIFAVAGTAFINWLSIDGVATRRSNG